MNGQNNKPLTPKRIQTIEKHEDIYHAYLELNQMLRLVDPEFAAQATQTFKHKKIAEQFYMHPKSIAKIINRKLRENVQGTRETVQGGK